MDCYLQTPSPPAAQRSASWLRTLYGPAAAPLFSLPKASARSSAPDRAPSARRWQPAFGPATSASWALGPIPGSKEKPHPRGPKVCTHKKVKLPDVTILVSRPASAWVAASACKSCRQSGGRGVPGLQQCHSMSHACRSSGVRVSMHDCALEGCAGDVMVETGGLTCSESPSTSPTGGRHLQRQGLHC